MAARHTMNRITAGLSRPDAGTYRMDSATWSSVASSRNPWTSISVSPVSQVTQRAESMEVTTAG